MKKLFKITSIIFIIILVIYYLVTLIAPEIVDKEHNKIREKAPYSVSDKANEIYKALDFIADMHCDALLWKRNLLKDNDFGQVDIPKMLKANVGLQAFTIVTKSPKGQNFDKNTGGSDNITSLYLAQGRPTNSLTKRAIYQCEALFDFAKKSEGKFRVITSSKEFKSYLSDKENNKNITAGFLGVEGAHALDGKIENVQLLFNNGVRMMAATHFFDNKLGGSAHGISGEGLTDFGKQVIIKMDELNMIIDIAHCSPKMVEDIVKLTKRPILSSHTGVKGTCDNVRNLSDKQIKDIANSGGLVSIAMFKQAVCGVDAAATAKAIKYTVDLVGVDFVALGSDFDGSVTTPFDITGLPLIVEELIKLGFTEEEIQKVMGDNVKIFLLKNLP
ncbi:MAG: peptidase M19 [Flavobacteriaceae bacterium]|nr:peptidase M19 [Flavobacteriaceae bacterium]